MTLLGWALTPAAAALLALLLWRGGLRGRLYLDALAVGVTLGAAVAVALAPFALRANPQHFSPQTLAFLLAGLPEEGVKMIGVAAFLRAHYLARDRRDVVFAAGALSLGFAALENIFYLANAGSGWAALAIVRALTAMPFHVCEGLAGGYIVASVRPGAPGVVAAVAGWLGLAAIHGAYDFAVFAGAPGAVAPVAFQRAVAALGLDLATTLRALLSAAQAAAALAAILAAAALRKAPNAAESGRLARWARGRAFGWLLGGALAAGALIVGLGGLFASVLLETASPFLAVALYGIMPLALGILLIVESPPSGPLSRRWRRGFAGAGLVAALALGLAGLVWGPSQWRDLTALRFETRGARLAASGDYDGAVEAYSQALAVAPDRIAALSQRAALYAAANRFPAALADLDAARRLAPDNVGLLAQRANVDRQRNDPLACIADYDAALKLKPGDAELLALRGQSRLEAGDAKGAYGDLAAASDRAPDNAVVRRIFAVWDVDAGDLEAALRDLNARLHADPGDFIAAFQRGRVWLYKGDSVRALADFERADRDPAFLYPALWRFLARVQLQQEGDKELADRLAKSRDKWPAPVARMLAGTLSFETARVRAANDGERCEADFYFAMAQLKAATSDESAARLREALKECPTGFIEYEGAKAQLRRLGRAP